MTTRRKPDRTLYESIQEDKKRYVERMQEDKEARKEIAEFLKVWEEEEKNNYAPPH